MISPGLVDGKDDVGMWCNGDDGGGDDGGGDSDDGSDEDDGDSDDGDEDDVYIITIELSLGNKKCFRLQNIILSCRWQSN